MDGRFQTYYGGLVGWFTVFKVKKPTNEIDDNDGNNDDNNNNNNSNNKNKNKNNFLPSFLRFRRTTAGTVVVLARLQAMEVARVAVAEMVRAVVAWVEVVVGAFVVVVLAFVSVVVVLAFVVTAWQGDLEVNLEVEETRPRTIMN